MSSSFTAIDNSLITFLTTGLKPDCAKTMVTDSAMKKSVTECSLIDQHIFCVDHILNNTIKEALCHPDLGDFVGKIKELSAATHKSLKRITLIRNKCKELKGESQTQRII